MIMSQSKVNLRKRGSSYTVSFTYAGKQHRLGLGIKDSQIGRLQALEIARQVELDMLSGVFDINALEKYKPSYQEKLKVNEAIKTDELISLVWNYYIHNKDLEETTLKGHYGLVDKALRLFPSKSPSEFTQAIKEHYSVSVQYQISRGLRTAFNYYAKKQDSTLFNPFKEITSDIAANKPDSKRSNQAFTVSEAKSIMKAFECGTYANIGHEHLDMFYAPFVKFLFLTGCRTEDAIALSCDDIESDSIVFSRAYSNGVLKGTKNGKTRKFPLSDELKAIVWRYVPENESNLVFPSVQGKYISANRFRGKYWKRVLTGLLNDGLIRCYLPPYHTRHTFISIQRDNGIPDAYIAKWCETSEMMISKHYGDTLSEKFKPCF